MENKGDGGWKKDPIYKIEKNYHKGRLQNELLIVV